MMAQHLPQKSTRQRSQDGSDRPSLSPPCARRRLGWFLLCLFGPPGVLALLPDALAASSIGFEQRWVRGIRISVVTANLKDPAVKVTVGLAKGFPATHEPFRHLIHRLQPVAAVTGTFFSTLSLLPIGDIVRDGQVEYRTSFGTALAITPNNHVQFHPIPHGKAQDWGAFETVLACGPTLLKDGEIHVAPRHEGFRDHRVLGRAPRTAVGGTAQGKLKLVHIAKPVTLSELAKILRDLGCVNAVNLDGGSSSAFYYRGSVIAAPSRQLVNVLACYEGVPPLYRYAPNMPAAEEQARKRAEQAHWWFQQAHGAIQTRKWKQADYWLEQAARLDGRNASYFVRWAEVLQKVGTREQVGAAYAKAAAIYHEKKLSSKASYYYELALKYHPRHLLARRALIRLLQEQIPPEERAAQRLAAWGPYRGWTPVGTTLLPSTSRGLPSRVVRHDSLLELPVWGVAITVGPDWRWEMARDRKRLTLRHRQQPASMIVHPVSLPADVEPAQALRDLLADEILPDFAHETEIWESQIIQRLRYATLVNGVWTSTDLWLALERKVPLAVWCTTPLDTEIDTTPLFEQMRAGWVWQ